jgi:hypothetical protein
MVLAGGGRRSSGIRTNPCQERKYGVMKGGGNDMDDILMYVAIGIGAYLLYQYISTPTTAQLANANTILNNAVANISSVPLVPTSS